VTLALSSQSTMYVKTRVTATVNGVAYNPTADVVGFAFLPVRTPPTSTTTFYPGSWETSNSVYYARCLVGPNVSTAAGWPSQVGTWTVWVKIVDNPETPILSVDTLIVE
jgi:hypothetical protein